MLNFFKKIAITVLTFIALPFVVWWVRRHEKIALSLGRPLMQEEEQWANELGILHTEKVRILNVTKIPAPVPDWLASIFRKRGSPVGSAAGMFMRYGIYIVEEHSNDKSLVAHELVHVQQCERLGGLWSFLYKYIYDWISVGYRKSPLEIEANTKANQVLA